MSVDFFFNRVFELCSPFSGSDIDQNLGWVGQGIKQMARPSDRKGILKMVMVLLGFCLACCIVGPPLYWRFKDNSRAQFSCGSCHCACDSDTTFSITTTLDCGHHDDGDIEEEMKKGRLGMLAEELHLQKNVSDERVERSKELRMEVRKASEQYREEVEKCSAGIERCEEGRAKVEAALADELKLSASWEDRARQLGWGHGI